MTIIASREEKNVKSKYNLTKNNKSKWDKMPDKEMRPDFFRKLECIYFNKNDNGQVDEKSEWSSDNE